MLYAIIRGGTQQGLLKSSLVTESYYNLKLQIIITNNQDNYLKLLTTTFHFTTTVVVMSHESNTCSVFVLQASPQATCIQVGPRSCHQPDAKEADMEKPLLSCDVTTYQSASEMRFRLVRLRLIKLSNI